MKKRFLTLVMALVILFIPMLVEAQTVKVVTEELPPYNFTNEDGEITGISTEIVKAVFKEAEGLNANIVSLPWARAYQTAQKQPGVLIYSMVRNNQREDLFKWIGKVAPTESYLYKLKKNTEIEIDELADAKRYKVGVVRGDAGKEYLEEKGFRNLQLVRNGELNIKKLIHGRVDLIEMDRAPLVYKMEQMGLDPNQLERVHLNKAISGQQYLAANKNVSPSVINKLKAAFKKIKANGTYDQIMDKWLN